MSQSFVNLGRAQQKALGSPDLPMAIVPHPFGTRSREELKLIAAKCADDIAKLLCEAAPQTAAATAAPVVPRAKLIEAPADLDELNKFFIKRRWGDGMIVAPPTLEALARMLRHTRRLPDEVVATIAPGMGAATVEYIAIQGVMAGCYPEYLPVLIAAAEAVAEKKFHLQAIQATTNPAAVWLIINGPAAKWLEVNSGAGCLGPGTWANATLGRALRLILQNIGGALPGEMDKATQGQSAKYSMCCAENEAANPWQPLHVERGFAADASTVTVVGALGTWNMNMTARNADEVLAMLADTMQYPASSDYITGGAPFVILSPQHAALFHAAGLSKADVKQRLWAQSRIRAGRSKGSEFERMATGRRAELGEITPDTMVPISEKPDDISIIVAGGPGSHSVFVPVSAHTRSSTKAIVWSKGAAQGNFVSI
ncbi:MAG: hypothetical protein FJY56_08590 [Betaproteobacteria bacterium]|nr:hypothetical protein [Betaproteobacteria bacterium]